MGLANCKNACVLFEQLPKKIVYELGECSCKNCDYYFKDNSLRCPCFNSNVLYSTRSNLNKSNHYLY